MTELFYKLVSTWSCQYRIHSFIRSFISLFVHCSCCALFDKCHGIRSSFVILHANGNMGPTDLHPLEGCERWVPLEGPSGSVLHLSLKDDRGLVSDNIVLILSGSQETQMSICQKSITRSLDLLILACLPTFFGMNFVAR